jgi:hypothetical protein
MQVQAAARSTSDGIKASTVEAEKIFCNRGVVFTIMYVLETSV